MVQFAIHIFMYVLVINGCFSLKLNWKEKRDIGKTSISVIITHPLREKRSSDHNNQLPVELDLDLNVNGSDVKLHLHRNDKIRTGVPIYVMKNGHIVKLDYSPKRVSALYQDISSGASVELESQTLGDTSIRHLVRGEFYYQNKSYAVQPEDDNHFPEDFTVVKDEDEDIGRLKKNVHTLFETKENVEYNTDYVVPKHKYRRLPRLQMYTDDAVAMKHRQKRSITQYQIEFLPVIDYSIYEFWYDYSSLATDEAKNEDAIDNIREFYAFVLNAIDVRYQSIDSSSISIELLFAGIFIANDSSSSPWTETNKVTASPRDQVDSGVALEDFQVWLNSQTDLPPYDHAMAFTGLDLTKDGSNSNAGLAWLGGTCVHTPTSLANSISEDHFDANMAATAAHELGHNLGSNHDGDGNGCDPNDKYVMSPSSGGITDSRASNHFIFSSCSVSQFETYINSLNSGSNCMLATGNSYDPDALNEYAGSMPGQVYNVDKQCEKTMGNGSYFCRGFYDDYVDLCGYLYCANPASPGSCRTVTAWEGTLCGNQKWCEAGQCVDNSDAPSASDSCPHGDQPGEVYDGQTCSELLTPYPLYCYQSYFSGKCCGTCESFETGIPGCPYGDREFGCSSSDCHTMSDSELIDCCETCPNNVTTQGPTTLTTTTPVGTTTTTNSPGATSTGTSNIATTTSSVTSGPSGLYSNLLDDLCESVVGPGSSMCRDFHYASYETVCDNLYCHFPSIMTLCAQISVPDETTCGSGKWCVSGACVQDSDAIDLPGENITPSCPYGDELAPVSVSGDCSAVINDNPNNCYQTEWQGMCCESCSNYYIGLSGCEYGDRSSQCEVSSCPNYNDHDRTYVCCASCAPTTTSSSTSHTTTLSPTTSTSSVTSSTTASNTGTTTPIASDNNSEPSSVSSDKNESTSTSDDEPENFLSKPWAVPTLAGCVVILVGGFSAATAAIVKIFCASKNAVVPFVAP